MTCLYHLIIFSSNLNTRKNFLLLKKGGGGGGLFTDVMQHECLMFHMHNLELNAALF